MQQSLARQFFTDMLLARRFEEAAAEQYTQGNIGGFLHLYPGEEAVVVMWCYVISVMVQLIKERFMNH